MEHTKGPWKAVKTELSKMPPVRKRYFVYSPGGRFCWLCYGINSHNADIVEKFSSETQAQSIADELNSIKKPSAEKLNNLIKLIRVTI